MTRTLLTVPYRLYRLPLAVIDWQVARRLPADSTPKLAFDKAVGGYDRLAGRLLGDTEIADRGSERIARSTKLADAKALEAKATAHRQDAAAAARAGADTARTKRSQSRQRVAEGLDDAAETERRSKQRAADAAAEKASRDKEQVGAVTEKRVSDVRRRRDQADAAADAKEQHTRRRAQAQLADVREAKAAASSDRSDAEHLDQLAAGKRETRRTQ
ncbi:MAG TPA: hypothetical protein VFU35_12535 [Jatrophihabitans sp.]|nr:hypothetical protein [Jatrophihabitans sp.]